MHRRRARGLTLIELLLTIAILAVAVIAAVALARHQDLAKRRLGCYGSLKNLGVALRLYLDGQGRRTQWPDQDGSDFLILLYITGVASDSGTFLCNASGDTNEEGGALRLGQGSGAINACSYAGRDNRRRGQDTYPGMFTTRNSSETTQAADDDDGEEAHHVDLRTLLFADGHCEMFPLTEPRLGAFSGRGGLLDPLSN